MQIQINRQQKLIGLWLERDEEIADTIPAETKELLDTLKRNKFTVSIYHAGQQPEREVIRGLVLNNA